jgi:hypothetical protein
MLNTHKNLIKLDTHPLTRNKKKKKEKKNKKKIMSFYLCTNFTRNSPEYKDTCIPLGKCSHCTQWGPQRLLGTH